MSSIKQLCNLKSNKTSTSSIIIFRGGVNPLVQEFKPIITFIEQDNEINTIENEKIN